MATKSSYSCTECGWSSVKWVGQCGECQAWDAGVGVLIAELERRVQADEAVRKAIRPQPAPQPNATPGPARTPPAP